MDSTIAAALLLAAGAAWAEPAGRDPAVLRWGERVETRPIAARASLGRPAAAAGVAAGFGSDPLAGVSRRIIATAEALGWREDPGTQASETLRPRARLTQRPDSPAAGLPRADPPNPSSPSSWLARLARSLKRRLLQPLAARLIGLP